MGNAAAKNNRKNNDFVQIKLDAAIIIQRNFRSFRAKCERKRSALFDIFQTLQTCHENEITQVKTLFIELLNRFRHAETRSKKRSMMKDRISTALNRGSIRFEVDEQILRDEYPIYRMKKINFPLEPRDFTKIIECVVNPKFNLLPPSCVYNVLKASSKELQRLSNVNTINYSRKYLIVIGAIHGNLRDLMLIFYKCGLPGPQTYYLFNGDLVDIGEKSIEVLIVILAAFLTFPQYVFLNRGNHEDYIMNNRFGLCSELERKYSSSYPKITYWLDEVFRWMPFATVVNDKIFVAHGGVPGVQNFSDLNKIKREKYVSLLKPVSAGFDAIEWENLLDIIWGKALKEHSNINECEHQRVSNIFDTDDTIEFLGNFSYEHVIVSNEITSFGYEKHHEGNLTIVSAASNFFSSNSNKGAVLRINDRMEFEYVAIDSNEFMMDDLGKISARFVHLQEDCVNALKKHLATRLELLHNTFVLHDPHLTGCVTFQQWAKVLNDVSGLNLKWSYIIHLLPGLQLDADEYPRNNSLISYARTLDTIAYETFFEGLGQINTCADTILRSQKTLEGIFFLVCKDYNDSITFEDFNTICEILKRTVPSIGPVRDFHNFAKSLGIDDEDDPLTLDQFLQIFNIRNKNRHKKSLMSLRTVDIDDMADLAE